MCLGAATIHLLGSLIGGLLIFLLLYFIARWADRLSDRKILRLVISAAKVRRHTIPQNCAWSPWSG